MNISPKKGPTKTPKMLVTGRYAYFVRFLSVCAKPSFQAGALTVTVFANSF